MNDPRNIRSWNDNNNVDIEIDDPHNQNIKNDSGHQYQNRDTIDQNNSDNVESESRGQQSSGYDLMLLFLNRPHNNAQNMIQTESQPPRNHLN